MSGLAPVAVAEAVAVALVVVASGCDGLLTCSSQVSCRFPADIGVEPGSKISRGGSRCRSSSRSIADGLG